MSNTPKSRTLVDKESTKRDMPIPSSFLKQSASSDKIRIREIHCLNDVIALLLFKVQAGIELPEANQYKNEGIVVGIGPGLPSNNGDRVKSQLAIGDVVMFNSRNVIAEVESSKPPYEGQRVVLISERNLLTKLPSVEFEIVG